MKHISFLKKHNCIDVHMHSNPNQNTTSTNNTKNQHNTTTTTTPLTVVGQIGNFTLFRRHDLVQGGPRTFQPPTRGHFLFVIACPSSFPSSTHFFGRWAKRVVGQRPKFTVARRTSVPAIHQMRFGWNAVTGFQDFFQTIRHASFFFGRGTTTTQDKFKGATFFVFFNVVGIHHDGPDLWLFAIFRAIAKIVRMFLVAVHGFAQQNSFVEPRTQRQIGRPQPRHF